MVNSKSQQHEVCLIGCLAHTEFSLDRPPTQPFNQHFCLLTKPADEVRNWYQPTFLMDFSLTGLPVKKQCSESVTFGYGSCDPYLWLTDLDPAPNPERVFADLLRRPGIDFQPGGPVRQPYFSYRPVRLHSLAESIPWFHKRLQIRALLFLSVTFKMEIKIIFFVSFPAYYFLKVHLHIIYK